MVLDIKIEFSLPEILENLSNDELQEQINERKVKIKKAYWDEINIDDKVEMKVQMTRKLVNIFAMISADYNPLHVDEEYGKNLKIFGYNNIAHGYFLQSFLSGLGGTYLLGEGAALHEKLPSKFLRYVAVDDVILAQKIVVDKFEKVVKGKTRYYVKTKEVIKVKRDDKFIIAVESGTISTIFKKSRK